MFITQSNAGLKLEPLSTLNANILQTISSSGTYLQHSIAKNMNSLLTELEYSDCQNKKNLLETEMVVASQLSSSNLLNQGHGYNVLDRGHVLQVTKCPETLVLVRNVEKCYEDLPVTFNGKEMFVDSMTKIIKDVSVEIDCISTQCSIFKIDKSFYRQCPNYEEITEVEVIEAETTIYKKWNEQPPVIGNLFGNTPSNMYDALMFPYKMKKAQRQVTEGFMSIDPDSPTKTKSPFQENAKNWLTSNLEKIGDDLFQYATWIISVILLALLFIKVGIAIVFWLFSIFVHIFAYGFRHERTKHVSLQIFAFIRNIFVEAYETFQIKDGLNQARQKRSRRNQNHDEENGSSTQDSEDDE